MTVSEIVAAARKFADEMEQVAAAHSQTAPPPPKRTPGEIAAEKRIQPVHPDGVRVTYSERNAVQFHYDGKVDWLVGTLREAVAALIDAERKAERERCAKATEAGYGANCHGAAAIRALD